MLQVQEIPLNYLLQFAQRGYLHAIIDSCDSPEVPPKMSELGETAALSLFKGSHYEEYTAVAPYIVTINTELLEWIAKTLWERPWGIMTLSKAPLDLLATHLRRFLFAFLPDGNAWYFRYYDPRTLLIYLNTCTQAELAAFFGPIHAFVTNCEGKLNRISMSSPVAGYQLNASLTLWPVRLEQIHALDQNQMPDFLSRLSRYLRSRFPERTQQMKSTQLNELVLNQVHRAMAYRITSELDLLRYVSFAFAISLEFDCDPRSPAIQQVLRDPALSGEERMDRLSEVAAFTEEIPTNATT